MAVAINTEAIVNLPILRLWLYIFTPPFQIKMTYFKCTCHGYIRLKVAYSFYQSKLKISGLVRKTCFVIYFFLFRADVRLKGVRKYSSETVRRVVARVDGKMDGEIKRPHNYLNGVVDTGGHYRFDA